MRKSWLVCVLLGTLAWGQARPAAPAQAPEAENKTEKPAAAPAAEVAMTADVITIKGVSCPDDGNWQLR